MSLNRLNPETFVIPTELSVEFQTFIQRLIAARQMQSVVEDWHNNLASIFHQQQTHNTLEDKEYVQVAVLLTPDESEAFNSAYEDACDKFDDIANAEEKFVHTALVMHTLEEYGSWRQIVD